MYCTGFVRLDKIILFFNFSKGTACKKLDALRVSANSTTLRMASDESVLE